MNGVAGSDFLAQMADSSRARVAAARSTVGDTELLARARATPLPPRLRLSGGFDLIAEVKLRSPAMGELRGEDEDVATRVAGYADAGAATISVLTEPSRFDGSLDHLQAAAQALAGKAPVMRKDFIVDSYQLIEARLAGAGGVLVILRMLSPGETAALLDMAAQLGLFVLLEAFDEADIELAGEFLRSHQAPALAAQAPLLVGVNCRDLVNLQVVPGRLEQLAPRLPRNAPRVAESGIESVQDIARLAAVGYTMALVGGALMTADDPGALTREFLATGRRQRGGV